MSTRSEKTHMARVAGIGSLSPQETVGLPGKSLKFLRKSAEEFPDHQEIEARLVNWGRWCNAVSSRRGHCGSIEWKWVETWKQRWGWKDSPDLTRILDRINVLDAERVQSIMQYLPLTYRTVLALKYVKHDSPKRIAYKANCREWELETLLFEILEVAKKVLTGGRNSA